MYSNTVTDYQKPNKKYNSSKLMYNGFEYLIKLHQLESDKNNMIIFNNNFKFEDVCKEPLIIWWVIKNLHLCNFNMRYAEIELKRKEKKHKLYSVTEFQLYVFIHNSSKNRQIEFEYDINLRELYDNLQQRDSEYLKDFTNKFHNFIRNMFSKPVSKF